MFDLSAIKSRISCVEFAQRNGLRISKSGDRCVSPLRQGATNKTSFVVYNDFFFDFGSGQGGDVIDLADKENAVCMISGAGSTLLLISDKVLDFKYNGWDIKDVNISNIGAYVYEK